MTPWISQELSQMYAKLSYHTTVCCFIYMSHRYYEYGLLVRIIARSRRVSFYKLYRQHDHNILKMLYETRYVISDYFLFRSTKIYREYEHNSSQSGGLHA